MLRIERRSSHARSFHIKGAGHFHYCPRLHRLVFGRNRQRRRLWLQYASSFGGECDYALAASATGVQRGRCSELESVLSVDCLQGSARRSRGNRSLCCLRRRHLGRDWRCVPCTHLLRNPALYRDRDFDHDRPGAWPFGSLVPPEDSFGLEMTTLGSLRKTQRPFPFSSTRAAISTASHASGAG